MTRKSHGPRRLSISTIVLLSLERMVPAGTSASCEQIKAWGMANMGKELEGRTLLANHVSSSLNCHERDGFVTRDASGDLIRFARTDKVHTGKSAQARKQVCEPDRWVLDIDLAGNLYPCRSPAFVANKTRPKAVHRPIPMGRRAIQED